MSKRVLILRPRLDIPFKNFEQPIPEKEGSYAKIREPWNTFANNLGIHHMGKGDKVEVLKLPMWRFTTALIENHKFEPELVYVPHRESHSFPIKKSIQAKYYMQSVIPSMFYCDTKGYAGGASFYPMNIENGDLRHGALVFNELQYRALQGISKFDDSLPPREQWYSSEPYVAFMCQLPHDTTILYHSNITVQEALRRTCDATQKIGIKLVVKAHPINLESMRPLREIANKYEHVEWVENVNVHSVLKNATIVVCVNSGTGMEALFHMRPVYTFGKADYDVVTMKGNLESAIEHPWYDHEKVLKFFSAWDRQMIQSELLSTFSRL